MQGLIVEFITDIFCLCAGSSPDGGCYRFACHRHLKSWLTFQSLNKQLGLINSETFKVLVSVHCNSHGSCRKKVSPDLFNGLFTVAEGIGQPLNG